MRQKKIAVIYHSHTGNTAAAAQAVVAGINEAAGFEVLAVNTNERHVDPKVLAECAGAAFGTPDYFSYPAGTMKVFIDNWLIAKRGGQEDIGDIPVALFITHGGGGGARQPFETLFRRIGPQVGETVMIKGKPDETALAACRKLGAELARKAQELLADGA